MFSITQGHRTSFLYQKEKYDCFLFRYFPVFRMRDNLPLFLRRLGSREGERQGKIGERLGFWGIPNISYIRHLLYLSSSS